MLQEIPELDAKGLRQFSLIFALIVIGGFGVILPLASGGEFFLLPWLIGGVFIAWGVLAPTSVRLFYRLWMRFGLLMNAIITRVVLGIVFYRSTSIWTGISVTWKRFDASSMGS